MTTADRDREEVARAFDKMWEEGRVDLDSGAWDHAHNQRQVKCARCKEAVSKGDGFPCNIFMTDYYRATTHYVCGPCFQHVYFELSGLGQALTR